MLTLDQAAEQFGVTRRTLERWIDRGLVNVVRMSRKCVRVRESELERAADRHTTTGPAPKPLKKKGKTK
jgi:excisionase family DNA binding protein